MKSSKCSTIIRTLAAQEGIVWTIADLLDEITEVSCLESGMKYRDGTPLADKLLYTSSRLLLPAVQRTAQTLNDIWAEVDGYMRIAEDENHAQKLLEWEKEPLTGDGWEK